MRAEGGEEVEGCKVVEVKREGMLRRSHTYAPSHSHKLCRPCRGLPFPIRGATGRLPNPATPTTRHPLNRLFRLHCSSDSIAFNLTISTPQTSSPPRTMRALQSHSSPFVTQDPS